MRKSLLIPGAAEAILRRRRFLLPALVALGAISAAAEQNNLVGTWRGAAAGVTLTVVILPNGRYRQLGQSAAVITQESGPYTLVAPNTIVFTVEDWEPETMPVYHPIGTRHGYYTEEYMAKPPDVMDTYQFKDPDTVTFTDQVYGGSITMRRVRPHSPGGGTRK